MFFHRRSPKGFLLSAIIVLSTVIGASITAQADPVVLDFEGFTDSTAVTNQYAGLVFTNATVLTAGISLNEFEFPPHSGSNVVFDDGGPMSISFTSPVAGFSGYFTYTVPITITASDASNNLLGSVTSLFSSNLALSGDPRK